MAKTISKYKTPKIVKAKRGWFIALYYERPDKPGSFKRFEISGGVNYIKDLKQREIALESLRKNLIKILAQGFDPFFSQKEQILLDAIEEKEKEINEKHWTLKVGFEKFMEQNREKELSNYSIKKYQSSINVILEWNEKRGFSEKRIKDYTTEDILEFLNSYHEMKGWSARSYNNYLDFLSYSFSMLEKMEKRENDIEIEYQVQFDFLSKKRVRVEKNQAFVGRIAELVKERLKSFPELNFYVQWLYFSCMRPSEIRHLTIKQIDLENRQIYIEAKSGKTGSRIVPISNELYELISELDLLKYPHTHYVFGKGGKGPHSEPVHEKYYSELFRKNIRIPLKLSNKFTVYGWKHTRVIDLLNAGFTDYEVMSLTGHKGFESFEKYKRDLIIDNEKMKGKTIGF